MRMLEETPYDEMTRAVYCHRIGENPRRAKRRPGDGREDPVFSDAVGRDVVAARVCHVDELGPQRRGQKSQTDSHHRPEFKASSHEPTPDPVSESLVVQHSNSLLTSFQIFSGSVNTHNGERTSSSLRLQMQRRRQGNRNPKRDPRWAAGRFCSFGPASTTFVHLYTLYMYCT